MNQTTCHGSRPWPSRSGLPAQRPFVCLKLASPFSARRTRSTSNQAPSARSAWKASTSGADSRAASIWSMVSPSSRRASTGTGRSVEGVSVVIVAALRWREARPGRRRKPELADVDLQLGSVLARDRRRAVLLPAALTQNQQAVGGQLTLALVDA